MIRQLSESVKTQIAVRQRFKCANSPNKNIPDLEGYSCLLWNSQYCGTFDEALWVIGHIIEIADGGNNNINNLQALCPACHTVKTIRNQNRIGNGNRNSIKINNNDIMDKINRDIESKINSVITNNNNSILQWFNDNCVFTNNKKDILTIAKIREKFLADNAYTNRKEKQIFSKRKFANLLSQNIHINQYFKKTYSYRNGNTTKNIGKCLIKWKFRDIDTSN